MSLRHAPWTESADFAIGLRPIPETGWLEGGEADPAARKDPLFAAARPDVFAEAQGSRAGQLEIARLVDAALGTPGEPAGDLPPLYAAARRVSDDLCLMEKSDGAWRLTALSLSAASFFRAEEVLGKSLAELHGPVNGFSERFLRRVERIFEGLRPGLVLERRNWSLFNSDVLSVPDPAPYRARLPLVTPQTAGEALFLRVERQTLRRLPQTGGAVFTIRIWLNPLADVAAEPARLAAFAQAWRSAPQAFRDYKRLALYDRLVEAFLRAHGESHSVNGTASPSLWAP
ncbi:MAG: heme-dependent oxidative N-demethylase subunit alpha family protein [Phenylobacterium sp.]|uniref:heme-dependent oxidative N-demethylase subunit alpha family protein n=1 Tax=Phenylobacterium sp. TaxID=1871053 RepID=UPI00391B0391